MELSRPENWSGQPFPSPGDLPNPGMDPRSPALQVDSSPTELQGKPKYYMKAIHKQYYKMQVTQSCLTLFDPMDYTVHGIL